MYVCLSVWARGRELQGGEGHASDEGSRTPPVHAHMTILLLSARHTTAPPHAPWHKLRGPRRDAPDPLTLHGASFWHHSSHAVCRAGPGSPPPSSPAAWPLPLPLLLPLLLCLPAEGFEGAAAGLVGVAATAAAAGGQLVDVSSAAAAPPPPLQAPPLPPALLPPLLLLPYTTSSASANACSRLAMVGALPLPPELDAAPATPYAAAAS